MRVRVVCMRSRGVALQRAALRSEVGVVGDLYVEEHDDQEARRARRVPPSFVIRE